MMPVKTIAHFHHLRLFLISSLVQVYLIINRKCSKRPDRRPFAIKHLFLPVIFH